MRTKQFRANIPLGDYAKIQKIAKTTYRTSPFVISMLLAKYEEKHGEIIIDQSDIEKIKIEG